jgi:hypothetical protein
MRTRGKNSAVARIDLKYAYPVKDRYGKVRWYFRFSGKNVRLHGEPGSTSFMADYHDAMGKIEPLSPPPIRGPAPSRRQSRFISIRQISQDSRRQPARIGYAS